MYKQCTYNKYIVQKVYNNKYKLYRQFTIINIHCTSTKYRQCTIINAFTYIFRTNIVIQCTHKVHTIYIYFTEYLHIVYNVYVQICTYSVQRLYLVNYTYGFCEFCPKMWHKVLGKRGSVRWEALASTHLNRAESL